VRAAVALARGDTAVAQQELERTQREADISAGSESSSGGPAQRLAIGLVASLVALNDPDALVALQISGDGERALQGHAPDRLAAHPELVAMISAARATALVRVGRLREGRVGFAAAVAVAEARGCEWTLVYCLSHLALLDAVDGALRQASHRAERALKLVTSAGVDGCGPQAASLVALAWVALQQGDAATARKRIADVPAYGGLQALLPGFLLKLAAARLARIEGDIDRAMEIAQHVREKAATSAPWVVDLSVEEEVASALSDVDKSVADHLVTALRERKDTGAQLTTARLQLRKRVAGAADSLGPVAARATEPLVAQVTAGLLVAEGALQRGESARARSSVERASRLAAPEGLRWPFHVASSAVRELVPRPSPPTIGRPSPTSERQIQHSPQHSAPDGRRRDTALADDSQAPLIDQLTVKELEVLNHLSELLTTEEIATAMFVSVNTVRTHVRSILRKLSVSRRHQAVRRARALDILTAP
jgi:LuxR family maltose regulon positive regulatory protein